MRLENKRLTEYLHQFGIEAKVKRLHDGSLKNTWRIYQQGMKWSQELADKLNRAGFKWIDGQPLDGSHGNGGIFSVFVRGHDELASPSKGIDA